MEAMSPPDAEKLVLAYRTTNAVEARALALELEDAEIEVQVIGDFRDGAYAGLSIGSMGDKELWIAARDQAAAEPIVAEWRRKHYPDAPSASMGKFQYSMGVALAVMTFAAVAAAAARSGPRALGVLLNLSFLALVLAVTITVVRRRFFSGRRADDETSPEPMGPPT